MLPLQGQILNGRILVPQRPIESEHQQLPTQSLIIGVESQFCYPNDASGGLIMRPLDSSMTKFQSRENSVFIENPIASPVQPPNLIGYSTQQPQMTPG